MLIDGQTYRLGESNFLNYSSIKNKIIIAHTGIMGMKHFVGWINRQNGKYIRTAPYTIDINGNIFEHYEADRPSMILSNNELAMESIVILLENEGFLNKGKDNNYYNWIGNIYNRGKNLIVERKWRQHQYWPKYTEEQFDSTLFLVNKLCDEFFIDKIVEPNNLMTTSQQAKGVFYRANFATFNTDLSPAWNFQLFKEKLEIK